MSDDKISTDDGNIRTLSNGALYDYSRGRIIANPPGGPTTKITKESSPIYHEMKKEERISAAYEALVSVADSRDIRSALPVFVAAQARLAMNEMAGRASTEAFRAVMQFAELWPDKKVELSVDPTGIGESIARYLVEMLQDNAHSLSENDIIDGEIVGNGNDNSE
jgi:hypothetical protein